jgi:hypothetical protein
MKLSEILSMIKGYVAFALILIVTILGVEGYFDIKEDLATTRSLVREQEFRVHDLRAQVVREQDLRFHEMRVRLETLERIGVEVSVIDFSKVSDLVYVQTKDANILDTYYAPGNNEPLIPIDMIGTGVPDNEQESKSLIPVSAIELETIKEERKNDD